MALEFFRVLNTGGGGATPAIVSGAVVGSNIVLTKSDATTVTINAATLQDTAFVTAVPAATATSTPVIVNRSNGKAYYLDDLGAGNYVYSQVQV